MTGFALKKSKKTGKVDGRVVTLTGEMTIQNAAEAKAALIDALADEDRITVDLKGLTAIDLTGLQLLCAAHRATLSGGKAFVVTGEDNEPFVSASRAAGLPRHVGCKADEKKTCIWVGGM